MDVDGPDVDFDDGLDNGSETDSGSDLAPHAQASQKHPCRAHSSLRLTSHLADYNALQWDGLHAIGCFPC